MVEETCLAAERGKAHTMVDKKYIQQLQKDFDRFHTAPKYSLDSEEVFCICRKPDNGELMVACDGCDEWFHFKCMKIDKNYKNLVNNYYCRFCDELFHKGMSVWKKKCKLATCYDPIDGESQFCSLDHGQKYWSEFLDKFNGNGVQYTNINTTEVIAKQHVENLIQSIDTREELLEIGNNLPVFDKNELVVTPEQQSEIADNIKSITALQTEIDHLKFKLDYLSKLKDISHHLDEFLSVSLDPNADAEADTATEPSKKKKNTKLNKKQKKFKIDICGFDRRLLLNNREWLEFTQSNQAKQISEFTEIPTNDELVYKTTYESMKNAAESGEKAYIPSDNVLSNLCISDKRKCHLHNGWFNIIKDGLELKINEKVVEIEKKAKDNDDLQCFIQIKNWKIYCDEV